VETDRGGVRKAAAERPEPRERRRRVALVVAADGVGDERVDVVRGPLGGRGEGASRGE
jgi:hypothetical protein